MVLARVKYSLESKLPPVTVSLEVPGTLALIRLINEASPLLMCKVAVAIKYRNCDWLTITPLTVMYSGKYLFPSTNLLTSLAALVICSTVKNSSIMGMFVVDQERMVTNAGSLLLSSL